MLKDEFYFNFKNANKEDVDKVINLLNEKDKELVIYLWSVNSKKRKTDSIQSKTLIKRISKILYKKNLFKVFKEFNKANLFDLVYDLDNDKLELLLKEYSFSNNEVKCFLTNEEIKKNNKTLSKIRYALQNGKKNFNREYNFNTNNYKGLFNQINEDKELILKAIDLLSEEEKDLLKLKYGENFDSYNLVDKDSNVIINVNIIRKIKRRIKDIKVSKTIKITDLINEDIDTIRYKVTFCGKTTRSKVYNVFGRDLSREVLLIGNQIAISKEIIDSIKNVVINESSLGKTLYNSLINYKKDDESNEEFINRINNLIYSNLSIEEVNLLKKKYGEDLNETVHGKDLTDIERYVIDHKVIYKLRNKLRREENNNIYYYKNLNDTFNKEEINLLKEFISKLSNEEKELFYKKYGKDLVTPNVRGSLSVKENEIVKSILKKFERYVSKKNSYNIRTKSLLSIYRLLKTNEYQRIRTIYGDKEALAIMLVVYAKYVSSYEMELVTGIKLDKALVLADCYLDNVDRNVYSKLLKIRKQG